MCFLLRLYLPKSKSQKFLDNIGEKVLASFPVQATIHFYNDDAESEEEEEKASSAWWGTALTNTESTFKKNEEIKKDLSGMGGQTSIIDEKYSKAQKKTL